MNSFPSSDNRPLTTVIAAMAHNRVIGKGDHMPWYIPEDFKYFKQKTLGKPMIMGRTTFESIHALKGTDPQSGPCLPDRPHIIVTRQGDYHVPDCTVCHSLEEAIAQAQTMTDDEIMICGGGQIYEQAIPLADRMLITVIDKDYEGDVFFPQWNEHEWVLVDSNPRDGFTFHVYEKIN